MEQAKVLTDFKELKRLCKELDKALQSWIEYVKEELYKRDETIKQYWGEEKTSLEVDRILGYAQHESNSTEEFIKNINKGIDDLIRTREQKQRDKLKMKKDIDE